MTIVSSLRTAALAGGFALAAAGGAMAADLTGLQAWAGKYPSDRIGGRQFFDHPGLRAEMRKTMGDQAYRGWQKIRGPEGPVVRAGDYVAAWRCQQHDCGDKNSTAIDSSGNGNHGRYVISEGGAYPPLLGSTAPLPIIDAGEVASVIPQVDRPALHVGKMVSETGQPAVVDAAGWRFPSVACHPATDLWGGTAFSVEIGRASCRERV